ncbi:MAG: hypothetical protein EBR02_05085 [Alphaproteobacteria bacterium]|nr:hypothetical protein [Alphaproteobacteria bacterium]
MKRFLLRLFLGILMVTSSYWAGSGRALAASNSYFEMSETRSTNLIPFPKWTGMVGRHNTQKKMMPGDCGKTRFNPCEAVQWKSFLDSIKNKSLDDQLAEVNDWGNKHPYIEDQINWGIRDFWEAPHEFMEIGGDCEDYAIAKYYSMRALGMSPDKLRVMIVQDFNLGGIIHAILGVYQDGQLLILDNQIKGVIPAMKIYHYRPIFGINETAWWAYTSNNHSAD